MGRIALGMTLIAVAATVSAPASASSPGWIVKCTWSHSLPDDPIVKPDLAGGSHLHDFIGNKSVDAHSTFSSMLAGGTTCSTASKDTAGYWTPALYKDGRQILPGGSFAGKSVRQVIYYRDGNLASGTKVRSIPKDLRIVAGNAKATSAAENPYLGRELYYGCSNNSTGKLKAPPSSCSTGIMSMHVGFPNCWDGLHLDSPNHMSHMAYPSSYKCPSTHPVALPRVIQRWEYPVGTSTNEGITLSSGPVYTLHGDFWNTWQQGRLDQLVTDCLNKDVDCGTI